MSNRRAVITAVEGYLPDYVLTNQELERMVDTKEDWIVARTGVRERRILKGEGLGTSYMAIQAAKKLLQSTGTDPESIDAIVCATVTPDMLFPATANIVGEAIGAKGVYGFDLNAACSGYLYALAAAAQLIESGRHEKVLLIGADKMSSIVDYTDRKTCILFGDAGTATLLQASEDESLGVKDFVFHSDGSGEKHLHQKAGGSRKPPTHQTVEAREHYVYQEGQPVFRAAVTAMADVSAEIMKRNNLASEDVAYLVPHQANKRIIDATANRMGVSEDKVMMNIHKYGNTTTATIPLCLWEYGDRLKKGDNLVLAAFGGGFTWGALYMTWGS